MNRFEAHKKSRVIAKRYFSLFKKFIYPYEVYTRLCIKYDLY